MFGAIFEFWYKLPVLLRIGLSLLLIGVSAITFLTDRIWISPGVIGLVLLFFAGSGSNKGGYNF